MAEPMSLSTSPTLLEQLRVHPGDRGAWEELVGRYAPRIRIWCRRSGLQEADVEDAVQAVLARLVRGMAEFRYDPSRSFRAYLKSLTRYAVCDLREAFARPDAGCGGSRAAEILAGVQARDDLMRHLEDEFDLELLREATRRASHRVEPTTWEAFRLVVEDGLPSREGRRPPRDQGRPGVRGQEPGSWPWSSRNSASWKGTRRSATCWGSREGLGDDMVSESPSGWNGSSTAGTTTPIATPSRTTSRVPPCRRRRATDRRLESPVAPEAGRGHPWAESPRRRHPPSRRPSRRPGGSVDFGPGDGPPSPMAALRDEVWSATTSGGGWASSRWRSTPS